MIEFEFEHIDDYNFLFGEDTPLRRERLLHGNKFKALISKYFEVKQENKNDDAKSVTKDNNEDLVFAIVEMVNINTEAHADGIGETYVYSTYKEEYKNKEILSEYKRCIKAVQDEMDAIAYFKEWYTRRSFMLLGENSNSVNYAFEDVGWKLDGEPQREAKSKDQYAKAEKLDFSDTYVKQYLNRYTQLIHKGLQFSTFPYYAIIARPISFRDGSSTRILGNLYLHFGTTKKHDKDFYLRLVNDLLLVWVNEKGGAVLEHLVTNAKISSLAAYCPRFKGKNAEKLEERFVNSSFTIKKYFDECFLDAQMLAKLEKKNEDIFDFVLPVILKNNGWLKENVPLKEKIDITFKRFKGNSEHKNFNSLDDRNLDRFVQLQMRRRIALICSCLFKKTMPETHGFLSTGEFKTISQSRDAIRAYLNAFFIYAGINGDYPCGEELFEATSPIEEEFLQECISKLTKLIRTECISDFNKSSIVQLQIPS